MSTRTRKTSRLAPAVLLSLAGVVVIAVYASQSGTARWADGLPFAVMVGACLVSSVTILAGARRPDAWRSAPWLGLGCIGLAILGSVFLAFVMAGPTPASAIANTDDVAFAAVGIMFLLGAATEFREHVPLAVRREVVADVILLSVSVAAMVFLLLEEEGGDTGTVASTALFATLVATVFASFASLALWVPGIAHLGMLVAATGICWAVLDFAPQWLSGTFFAGTSSVEVPISLSCLLLAVLATAIPRPDEDRRVHHPGRPVRTVLTALSVAAAGGALVLVATRQISGGIGATQGSILIGVLAAVVSVRILLSQTRAPDPGSVGGPVVSPAAGAAERTEAGASLRRKEQALRDTDQMLQRLQRANETLRESEERLRAVFESAADGIVELDQDDMIVRANGAFCAMLDLPRSAVEGRSWTTLTSAISADLGFATLPVTGQGTLHRGTQSVHLEARTSQIPGDPPRRIVLVRDVSNARVADQTIRQLFKYLQDRDEDRTRIMRRTNAAIESERNRIARDLHDGPVQGVSAASLSMEAVLLMLRAGDIEEGTRVLAKVRRELSEEADGLRQLMSGLRPPLLEERGLIPALREMLSRFGRDNGVRTHFKAKVSIEVPQDLETLAYRVVQEALANSAKHAGADNVTVWVETVGGQLRVEIEDDGVGFDAGKAREHLQMGRVGLASMRERVELANGTFMVRSSPGKGTSVLATLPLDAVPEARAFSVNQTR